MKQTFRLVVVLLVSASLVVVPMRKADAFVAAAAPILVTAGGPVVWTVAALAALVAAGTAIWAIKFKDSGTDVLELELNSKNTQRVPSGWTAASPASNPPVPPGTAGSIVTTYWTVAGTGQNNTTYTTPLAACQAFFGGACTSVSGPYTPGNGSCASGSNPRYCAVPQNTTINDNVVTTCPTGYTLSGSSCNLSNASIVPFPNDNVARKKISAGAWVDDTRDTDTLPGGVTAGSTTMTVKQGTQTTTVTLNGDGTITAKNVTGNGDGTSTVTTLKTSAPSGAADGGTNSQQVTSGQAAGEGDTATETAPNTCAGGPCATEGTQLANKALLQDMSTNGVKQNEQDSTWSSARSAATTKGTTLDTAVSDAQTKFAAASTGGVASLGVTGLGEHTPASSHEQGTLLHALFPSPATCAAVTFGGYRTGFTLDICPVVAIAKPIVEWLLYGLTLFYIYALFWRRKQEQR